MNLLTLFLVFQGAWFATVWGGAQGTSLWALAATVLVLGLLTRVYPARGVLMRAAIGVACGIVLDGAMVYFELTVFSAFGDKVLPLWMLCLWATFAAILPYMVPWLAGRRVLGIVFGATGGPIAYFSAEKLGAIEVAGLLGYSAVGLAWAAAMAVLPLADKAAPQSRALGSEVAGG